MGVLQTLTNYYIQLIFEDASQEAGATLQGREGQADEGKVRRRWQGQEEEVVQRKNQGQTEQRPSVRQDHLRKTLRRSSQIQTYHSLHRVRASQGQGIPRQIRTGRAPTKRTYQADR